ncbi:MAG: iron-containing alcohol dehydrogenase [Acidimicrobiia bacterium]
MNLFPVEYGIDLIEQHADRLEGAVVITQPEVWSTVSARAGNAKPAHVEMAEDLSPEGLADLLGRLPRRPIVGIGGGVAMDVAKWLHWRTGASLTQIPGLPSVNACFTRMTALRDGGIVRYEGDAVPDVVLVDFSLMRSAPIEMLRAGIGDVLSCHTARFDWELAVAEGHSPDWDEEAASASKSYLAELESAAPGIREGSDEGIMRLMELHREIGWRCHALGHARFEEGSEHFFAYCFEEVTGRTILHGEIVTLGVLVMSTVQRNDPLRAMAIADAAGTRHKIDELGISWDETTATLRRLPAFAREGGYWESMAQRMSLTPELIAEIEAAVRS